MFKIKPNIKVEDIKEDKITNNRSLNYKPNNYSLNYKDIIKNYQDVNTILVWKDKYLN